jgi:hypothetical protein
MNTEERWKSCAAGPLDDVFQLAVTLVILAFGEGHWDWEVRCESAYTVLLPNTRLEMLDLAQQLRVP